VDDEYFEVDSEQRMRTLVNSLRPEVIDPVVRVILERWPHRVITSYPPWAIITQFNDHGNTTKENVIAVLEEAAERAG
jgi:hypothetical protein